MLFREICLKIHDKTGLEYHGLTGKQINRTDRQSREDDNAINVIKSNK